MDLLLLCANCTVVTEPAQCPTGYACNSSAIVRCRAGTFAQGGACNECGYGFISMDGASTCSQCPFGSNTTSPTGSYCICYPGRLKLQLQSMVCVPCFPGYMCMGGAMWPCPSGSYCEAGIAYRCPGGVGPDYTCLPCGDGLYQLEGECLPCPQGSYCSLGSAFPCSNLTCPLGQYLSPCDNSTDDQCLPCPQPPGGYFEWVDEMCGFECPHGYLVNGTCLLNTTEANFAHVDTTVTFSNTTDEICFLAPTLTMAFDQALWTSTADNFTTNITSINNQSFPGCCSPQRRLMGTTSVVVFQSTSILPLTQPPTLRNLTSLLTQQLGSTGLGVEAIVVQQLVQVQVAGDDSSNVVMIAAVAAGVGVVVGIGVACVLFAGPQHMLGVQFMGAQPNPLAQIKID